ncbi:MAG: ATP-binding protein [Candidatus Thiodiazotropha sp. (ex. Lucinoma kazani)]
MGGKKSSASVCGLERRLSAAHIGRFKPLADFDWNWPDQCDQAAVSGFMTLRFIKETTNIILVGPNGVGKIDDCAEHRPPCRDAGV